VVKGSGQEVESAPNPARAARSEGQAAKPEAKLNMASSARQAKAATEQTSTTGSGASAGGGGKSEIFYRGMSNEEFSGLKRSGSLFPANGESFVTQDVSYIEGLAAKNPRLYQTIVGFEMAPGTRQALVSAGARAGGSLLEGPELGDLPSIQGKGSDVVHIKQERGRITYGLRPGSVDIFNERIISFSGIPFVP
jgi:hypothetical protein